jgi:hypothetical protein
VRGRLLPHVGPPATSGRRGLRRRLVSNELSASLGADATALDAQGAPSTIVRGPADGPVTGRKGLVTSEGAPMADVYSGNGQYERPRTSCRLACD